MTRQTSQSDVWRHIIVCAVAASCGCLITATGAQAQLKLPRLIADHMVMQRSVPIPVWGWASPEERIDVSLGGAGATVMADSSGKWEVALPAMSAGGPHTLTVRSGAKAIEVHDILVGDVWLASGQSNMEWQVVYSDDAGPRGSEDEFYVACGGQRTSLAGDWSFRSGAVEVDLRRRPNKVPSVLYNQMVHPLHKFPIKGVIWYQGEGNTRVRDLKPYRTQFSDMIGDRRRVWRLGAVPFLWVQLAAFHPAQASPGNSKWAGLREAQSAALSLPNTGQVVAIDIGDADHIHPTNKQDVGYRLALAARKIAYHENVEHSGPVLKRFSIENGRIRIAFDHVAEGLLVGRGGRRLDGFAVAGVDRKFVWAEAMIEGHEVVVWSDAVPAPVAVRYAWADNPERANLYNSAGLPASPFRTDDC